MTQRQRQPTLVKLVKRQLARKVFPVHRLDHRTSGAMLLVFDSQTCGRLHKALMEGEKQYIALLRGDWWTRHDKSTFTVNAPVPVQGVEKEAMTRFTVLASCNATTDNDALEDYDGSCCLILVEPVLTGRTHQIRRHAREMGQPVIGDTAHGDSRVNRWWRQRFGFRRLALHCLSLQFELEETTTVTAPLPDDFKSLLSTHLSDAFWKQATTREPRLLTDHIDVKGGTHGRNYRKRQQQQA